MSEEKNEIIILEVYPTIDVEDYMKLKYNLSAIMSGLSDQNYFDVEISFDSYAKVYFEDGIFNIIIYKSDYNKTYITSSAEHAMLIICSGEEIDYEEKRREIEKKINELVNLVDYFKSITRNQLTEEELYQILYSSDDLDYVYRDLTDN